MRLNLLARPAPIAPWQPIPGSLYLAAFDDGTTRVGFKHRGTVVAHSAAWSAELLKRWAADAAPTGKRVDGAMALAKADSAACRAY